METLFKIGCALILSIFGGILYRMGGSDRYNTKWRDIGTPLCAIFVILLWIQPVNLLGRLMILLNFIFAFALMTTYWDEIFGYDNYYVHGFATGLSSLPLYWIGISWQNILFSAIVCGFLMGLWSRLIDKDIWEEQGRGFIYCITRLLLI